DGVVWLWWVVWLIVWSRATRPRGLEARSKAAGESPAATLGHSMQISNSIANPATSDTRHQPLFPAGHLLPFFLVTALFFLWGVPNNLNDVLIRQFMKSFAITRF